MTPNIDVDDFVKKNQDQIYRLVNAALNRSGEIIQKKVSAGEVGPSLQEVLPLLLYELLVTHTVSTLRLVADMFNVRPDGNSH
ncbi:MAG: hypothetical protein K6T66_00570 [Peptococcaceae bacterium]|nr:hypothetical protein [Peptococcaceae bacterium]